MPEPTQKPEASPASHHSAHDFRSAPRWMGPAALTLSLIAVAAAGWAVLRPQPTMPATPPPAGVESQPGDPKAAACDAYRTVSAAVSLQTHADAGSDPAAVQGVAANARLAMAGGATYLLAHVSSATPAELAETMRRFAAGLQDISMNALAGVTNTDPAQAARLQDAQAASNRLVELCK
ncbi:hypothetical protein ACXDF8_23695 [Mycolicibacterium sp. CBM1]